jgi:MoaA/NifB/PqqE/SkfB family radical SAM enzyme
LGREFIEAGVKAVILIGGGEPLAHRKVGDLIELFGKNNIHVGITTNGSFIDRYMGVIAEYVKWTRVSMDAATEKMYGILRPTKGGAGNKFERIINNMKQLAQRKKGKLGYSFLIQTPADGAGIVSNVEEIYDAALLAREIGCDYFEVKPTYQFRGGVDHALVKHSKELMTMAAKQVAALDGLETDKFKVIRAINLKHSLGGVEEDQPKDYHQCPSTHLRTTVTPTGVFVCPYWRGKERMQIGDVTKQSFKEMWMGELRREVMERLDPSIHCNFHCLRHDTNKEAIRIKQRLDSGMAVVPVEEFDRFI